jgi:hypothetical protein
MYNTQEHNKFIYTKLPLNDIKYQLCYLKRCLYTQKFYLFIVTSFFFIITCSFSVFVENFILLPKGINEFVVFLCIVHAWFLLLYLQPLRWNSWLVPFDRDIRLLIKFLTVYTCITFHFFALQWFINNNIKK